MKSIFKLFGKIITNKWFILVMLLMIIIQMIGNGGNPLIKYELQEVSENYYQIKVFGTYIDLGGTFKRFTEFMANNDLDSDSWSQWFNNISKYFDNYISSKFDVSQFSAINDVGSFFSNVGVFFKMLLGGIGIITDVLGFIITTLGKLVQTVVFIVIGCFNIIFNPVTVTLT